MFMLRTANVNLSTIFQVLKLNENCFDDVNIDINYTLTLTYYMQFNKVISLITIVKMICFFINRCDGRDDDYYVDLTIKKLRSVS